MAANEHKRLIQAIIDQGRAGLLAIKKLSDYKATNAALSVEVLSALEAELRAAEENHILLSNAQAAASDARTTAGWALHNRMLGIKANVTVQYGASSDAVQSLGLKKKQEYRRLMRRRTTRES